MALIALFGAALFAGKVTRPLEEELRREKAAEENRRLFFSAASHELKTPIASARALVEGMIAGVGDYRDHPKYLRECLKTLDSQSRLVSEILEIVKLDEKEKPLPSVVELSAPVRSLAEEYRPLAEQRGLRIQADLPPCSVRTDWPLLRRALSNVVANAVQNSPPGGSVRIFGELRDRGVLRLGVFNTGARIPGEALPRLFEPFYLRDSARTRQSGRSGLGLTIVKKALDRLGLPFALENAEGGVLFWVDLFGE
jgi:two-component system sensor histidine kinase VanS